MAQFQKDLADLNSKFSGQLTEVNDPTQQNEILMKWKDRLIEHNKTYIETIAKSAEILASASQINEDEETPDDDLVAQSVESMKETVKNMARRDEEALGAIKNFIAMFEEQYRANKGLSNMCNQLRAELKKALETISEHANRLSQIEDENFKMNRILSNQISDVPFPNPASGAEKSNAPIRTPSGLSQNTHKIDSSSHLSTPSDARDNSREDNSRGSDADRTQSGIAREISNAVLRTSTITIREVETVSRSQSKSDSRVVDPHETPSCPRAMPTQSAAVSDSNGEDHPSDPESNADQVQTGIIPEIGKADSQSHTSTPSGASGLSRSHSKNDTRDLASNADRTQSEIIPETGEADSQSRTSTPSGARGLSRSHSKDDSCKSDADVGRMQSEVAREVSRTGVPLRTSTFTISEDESINLSQSINQPHDVESELKQQKELLERQLEDCTRQLKRCQEQLDAKLEQIPEFTQNTQQPSSSEQVAGFRTPSQNKEINGNLTRQLEKCKGELAAKNLQIEELERNLNEKTRKLESSTFVMERSAQNRSMNKDDTNDLSKRLENCKAELAAKNKQIDELTQKLPGSNAKKPSNTADCTIRTGERDKQRDGDETDITDAELFDSVAVRKLQRGARTMASLVKEKYDQLREQRDEINSLRQQLDRYIKKRGSNENRVLGTENEECTRCEQLKERLATLSRENEFQMRIYTRKLYLQEGQMDILMAENQQLLHKNTNLMKGIKLCQQELSRFIISGE